MFAGDDTARQYCVALILILFIYNVFAVNTGVHDYISMFSTHNNSLSQTNSTFPIPVYIAAKHRLNFVPLIRAI